MRPVSTGPRLEGARILLTGRAREPTPLAVRLAAEGARVEQLPAIRIEPFAEIDRPVRQALGRLAAADWVIFTSASALEALAGSGVVELCSESRLRVACVGGATASAYTRLSGVPADLVGPGNGAAGLATTLAGELSETTRLLWIRGERAAVDLRERFGAERLEQVIVYRVVPTAEATRIARELGERTYDIALFSSPSGVDAVLAAGPGDRAAARDRLGGAAVVAIGATTRQALIERLPDLRIIETAKGATSGELLLATLRAWEKLAKLRVTICARPAAGAGERRVGRETGEVRQTPLHDAHERAGARLVDFAGWHMPVQYAGVIDEHLAVRRAAGLFDVSHMGEARVRGAGALEFLQYVTCNDVSRLAAGRAHYTAMTTERGTFVDDFLIYMRDEHDYLLVLNAANTPKDVAWLLRHSAAFDVEVSDVSSDWAQIAVQGPRAAEIVERLRDGASTRIRYYRFREESVAGVSCILSRTGYTGEDGYELYCAPNDAPGLWARLLECGADDGLMPVGLAARDTLRLEAKMALYGNDIDDTTTVLEADLGWIFKPDKGEFIGRAALLAQQARGIERKLVGFELRARGIARHGCPAYHAGQEVGRVTSGSHAPFLEKSIGLAYLPVGIAEPGTAFEVDVRGRRLAAEVVQTPFYSRQR